jgi:putative flippase GtrA
VSPARRRSLAASLVTTALDAGLFALATLFLAGPPLTAARWGTGALGAVANFLLNRRWAFRVRGQAALPQAGRYALTALAAVSLATAIWWMLSAATGRDPRLLHLASLGVVWLGFTFPVLRAWVFVVPRSTSSAAAPGAAGRSSRSGASAPAPVRACASAGRDTAPPRRSASWPPAPRPAAAA